MHLEDLIEAELDLLVHWQIFHLRIVVFEDGQATDHLDHFKELGTDVLVALCDFVSYDHLGHPVDVREVFE